MENISSPWELCVDFVDEFYEQGREELRQRLENTVQKAINEAENGLKGSQQIWTKHDPTPVGTITVKRRAYQEKGHLICKADQILGLSQKRLGIS